MNQIEKAQFILWQEDHFRKKYALQWGWQIHEIKEEREDCENILADYERDLEDHRLSDAERKEYRYQILSLKTKIRVLDEILSQYPEKK